MKWGKLETLTCDALLMQVLYIVSLLPLNLYGYMHVCSQGMSNKPEPPLATMVTSYHAHLAVPPIMATSCHTQ